MARYEIDNRHAPIDFEAGGTAARTLQNAKNLLMTRMGEIPYDRYRGLNPALFDLPIGQMQAQLLPEIDRVLLWEPDAEAVEAYCTLDEKGEVTITAIIEIVS